MNRKSQPATRRISPRVCFLFLTLAALLSASCSSIPSWRGKFNSAAWRQQLQPLLSPFQKPAPTPPAEQVAPPPPVAIRPSTEEQSEALPPSASTVTPEIVLETTPVPQKPEVALPGMQKNGTEMPLAAEENPMLPPTKLDLETPGQNAEKAELSQEEAPPEEGVEEGVLKTAEAAKLGDSTHAIRIVSTQQGELAPNALVLVQPGKTLEFRVQIAEAPTPTESEGVKTKTRTPAKTVLNQNRKDTNDRKAGDKPVVRRLFLKASKGTVVSSLPGKAVWQAPDQPGLQTLDFTIEERDPSAGKKSETRVARGQVRVQTLHPFNATESKEIEGFPIGQYPDEKSPEAKAAIQSNATSYTPPQWLVRVTPELEKLHVSPHFTLSELALRSEQGKEHFIALDPRLVSFLESLRTAAQSKYGEKARIGVLRGYMSPAERERLAGQGIQYVQFSRYQYGNCAAIYLDLTNSGKMSDLNKDGRVDVDDARALEELVRSVRAQRKETGWVGTFEKPLEPDWPQTPFTAFDVRPQTKR
ncbi:MAG TPA: hypothetical protein PLA90_03045 [Candidatus Sumerlaeota bacterium]|nr:hypothetical protein [Candidatus Sumerlaeota bacterium]HPS00495.1 hypothetical protein [Candidatus Sumerlaeota bacterium]